MKRSLWAILFSVVILSTGMFADTRLFLVPNDGSGDNFAFRQSLNGTTISIDGGIAFDSFNIFGYAPGLVVTPGGDVFFSDFNSVTINGTRHELDMNGTGSLFASSITLPTNPQDFAATVLLEFSAVGTIADTGQVLDISGSQVGTMTFSFVNGAYYAGAFIPAITPVPEPGTLGLMGSGLIGVLGLARKRLRV